MTGKNVLCSMESKFEVFGQRRRIIVRRSSSEKMSPNCEIPTVKHGGGSVLIWECFSLHGTSDNKNGRCHGIRTISEGHRIIGRNFEFMHDNNPTKLLKVMKWPPQSLVPNSIAKL